jgi:hypothetical protein
LRKIYQSAFEIAERYCWEAIFDGRRKSVSKQQWADSIKPRWLELRPQLDQAFSNCRDVGTPTDKLSELDGRVKRLDYKWKLECQSHERPSPNPVPVAIAGVQNTAIAESKKPTRGRPPEYNWDGVKSRLAAYASQHGPVQTLDELLQKTADFANELHPQHKTPSDKTMREAIKAHALNIAAGFSPGKKLEFPRITSFPAQRFAHLFRHRSRPRWRGRRDGPGQQWRDSHGSKTVLHDF